MEPEEKRECKALRRALDLIARVNPLIYLALAGALFLVILGVNHSKNVAIREGNEALGQAQAETLALEEELEAARAENQRLSQENARLEDKIQLLSAAVNESSQAEVENAQKSDPVGYPLSGTASMEEKNDEDGQPLLEFDASGAEMVLAAANGTVTQIATDQEYGVAITMDHGNGYETIYRLSGSVKVQEGDEITGGTLLAEMDGDHTVLGYQIRYQGEYISPVDKLDIHG